MFGVVNGAASWIVPGLVFVALSVWWGRRLFPLYRDIWNRRRAKSVDQSMARPSPKHSRNLVLVASSGIVVLVLLAIGLATENHGHFPLWDQWVLFVAFWAIVLIEVVHLIRKRTDVHPAR
jgi:hypothetical protein